MTTQDAAGPEPQPAPLPAGMDAARLKVMEIVGQLRAASQRKFTFLLVGRAGMGKSSLVNSLLGQAVATVGDYEATTPDVTLYEAVIEGVTCAVADTPGLCDDLPEAGNDARYLEMIRARVSSVDCMWFVTRLDEARVSSDDKRGIQMITAAFGPQVWERSVLVFTWANNLQPGRYAEALQRRAELIRAEVAHYTGATVAGAIPAVAADNHADATPDGKPWLGELYTAVFERISASGALPFLMATASRVRAASAREPSSDSATRDGRRITLDDAQRTRITRRIDADVIPTLATLGLAAGAAFGPVGAAIGGALGMAVGLLVWLRK